MKQFLKFTLATIVGIIITFFLLIGILLGIAGVIVSSVDKPVEIKEHSILRISLEQQIVERSSRNPLENFNFIEMKSNAPIGLDKIIESIKKAKDDDRIKGIFLELSQIKGGISTVEEIRNALLDFKKSGKFILAYSDNYTTGTYYLSSVADKIYLNPEGMMLFYGIGSEVWFIKNSLAKLGVEPQIFRHGKFKSAVEPLICDKLSNENKQQLSVFLNSIWNHLLAGISEQRHIDVKTLNKLADGLVLSTADSCVSAGLVDSLLYADQINEKLIELSGQKGKTPEFVSLEKYFDVPKKYGSKGLAKDKIAVIYAYGEVDMGNEGEGTVSAIRISKALRDARLDTSIKAIVFRINSPGGSAQASDIIWREVKLATKTKPLIASMGDLAASGGYYIACAADTIVASPVTITGSIGVFGVIFNAKELLNKKLGVTTDRVGTNAHSNSMTISEPLSKEEKAVVQAEIEHIYNTFLLHVAEGRNLTKEKVDEIAQGRVWTGNDAVKIGLVDTLGTLQDAIAIAARRIKSDNYRIVSLPKLEDPFEKLLKDVMGDVKLNLVKNELGENYKLYKSMQEMLHWEGIQARMLYNFEIH